jgi:hypothetical protein
MINAMRVCSAFLESGIIGIVTGIREQGIGNRDQGTGIRAQGSGNRDQGIGIREQGTGNRE